jgi:AraC-like DNA-binding protein
MRRKQVEELLTLTTLTFEQIGDSLGYAETTSLAHAFKRWTGRSPRAFRNHGRTEGSAAAKPAGQSTT